MTNRKKDVRSKSSRRPLPGAIRRCVTEALEERRLFAVSLVSVGLGGAPANGASGEASVSADGRYVVFSSVASNLVEGDTNGKSDVFLRDRDAGTTTLISRNPTTQEVGNADSLQPVINQDGTFVAFVSKANNLLPNDTQNHADVFRYNVATRALELASARNPEGGFAGGSSSEPTISKDGNLVSFTTSAGNMGVIDGDRGKDEQGLDRSENDVFVRNMGTATVFGIGPKENRLVSRAAGTTGINTAAANRESVDSWMSEDGRFITFRSSATNLVAGGLDQNNYRDTYLYDLQTGTMTLISVNAAGTAAANAESQSNSVSGDGKIVLFQSKATDIVGNDGNGDFDIFLRDTAANSTRLLTVNRTGNNSAGGFSEFPAMSQDGSYGSWSSYAPDIVPGDDNGREDVFLRDLARGPLSVLSVNAQGKTGNGRSYDPFINRNGTHVAFTSSASDLTANDTNGREDIFIADVPQAGNTTDTQAPTATFGQVLAANPDATTFDFTVNLSDDVGLNTVAVGDLTVTRTSDNATFTAKVVPGGIVGTGRSAVVTYRVTLPSAASQNTGNYVVNVPAGAIQDASGKSVAAGPLAGANGATTTFALSTGSTPGTPGTPGDPSTIGDPNGPDLQIVSPGKAPTKEVIGGKKGSFKWKARNGGPGLLNHTVTFTVHASADTNFDAGDTTLGTVTKFLKKMKTGKAKSVGVKFLYPTDMGNGNYYLLVRADTTNAVAESNETNNVGTSAATALIRQPFTDLEPTTVGKPSRISAGSQGVVSVTIKNNGNVPFKGAVPVAIALSTDGTIDGTDRVVTTATANVSVKNGKTKTVKVNVPLPADLAPGTYFVGADVDPANAFAESNEDNNLAASFAFNSI